MINRIFGIGLSRTGTTSLTHALMHVGIDMIHYPTEEQLFDPKVKAISDIPVAYHFKDLDKKFPNSKFIYTIRDRDSWIDSMERHFTKHKPANINNWLKENRKKVYGSVEFNKDLYLKAFDEHDKNVREYFNNRDDFLILNIVEGDSWSKLLPFLEIKTNVNVDFPHKRKTKNV
jgi:hypothetical protein